MVRTLIIIGATLVIVGALWPFLSRIGFGRLPGDIVIHRGSTTIYIPFTTMILVSLFVSALLWLFRR